MALLWKGKKKAPSLLQNQTSTANQGQTSNANRGQTSMGAKNEYSDRQLAQNRYSEAVNNLKNAIKIRKGTWNSFDFDKLGSEPEGLDDS